MVRVEGAREDIYPVVEAVGMWESRRDFQRVWEGWKAGFMAFHAFHTLSFPWPALEIQQNRTTDFRLAGTILPSATAPIKINNLGGGYRKA